MSIPNFEFFSKLESDVTTFRERNEKIEDTLVIFPLESNSITIGKINFSII